MADDRSKWPNLSLWRQPLRRPDLDPRGISNQGIQKRERAKTSGLDARGTGQIRTTLLNERLTVVEPFRQYSESHVLLNEPRLDVKSIPPHDSAYQEQGVNRVFEWPSGFLTTPSKPERAESSQEQAQRIKNEQREEFKIRRKEAAAKEASEKYYPLDISKKYGPQIAERAIDTKQTIARETGGNTLVLAIASQETDTLSASEYPFGDSLPPVPFRLNEPTLDARGLSRVPSLASQLRLQRMGFQEAKTGDAANFGVYKMNWYMIKQTPTGMNLIKNAHKEYRGNEEVEIYVGRMINADPKIATRILQEAMSKWSTEVPNPELPPEKRKDNFWAGQRRGSTGLDGEGNWYDILDYYDSVMKIKKRIDQDLSEYYDSVNKNRRATEQAKESPWKSPLKHWSLLGAV